MQQITLEEAATHLPELVREVRGGQEIIFTDGHQPVARLISMGEDTPTPVELARISIAGGAFDWLAEEPDLYDDTCGEAIS